MDGVFRGCASQYFSKCRFSACVNAGYAAEFSYRRQGVGKQLQQASNAHAKRAVILGAEYTERKTVVVKDLAAGKQVEIPIDQFMKQPTAAP